MIGIGPMEILIILVVALLVIGPEKMPELARGLARIMRDVRGIMDEVRQQFEEITREDLLDTKEIDAYYRETIDNVKKSMEPPPEIKESPDISAEAKQLGDEVMDSLQLIEKPKKESPPEEPPAQPSP
jgi:Tat protein translocase TatB subunit